MRAPILLAWRSLCDRPRRTLLNAAGIIVGVALVMSVTMSIRAMEQRVLRLTGSDVGDAALMVTPAESGRRLPPELQEQIESVNGVDQVLPQIQFWATVSLDGGLANLRAAAIDQAAEVDSHTYRLVEGVYGESGLLLEEGWARSKGVAVGDQLSVLLGRNQRVTWTVTGLVAKEGLTGLTQGLVALVDLNRYQADMQGQAGISRFYLTLAPRAEEEAVTTALKAALPATAAVGPILLTKGSGVPGGLLEGLEFFAGTAALVGAFLVFGSFALTLRERTAQTGMTLAVGATTGQVTQALMLEALGLGLVGSAIGSIVGMGLSFGMLKLVSLSAGVPMPASMSVAPADLLLSFGVGAGVSLLAGLLPAWRAARVTPLEAIRSRVVQGADRTDRSALVGLALAAVGLIGWRVIMASQMVLIGQAFTVLYYIGLAMAIPLLVRWGVARLLEPWAVRAGAVAVLAVRNLGRHISRASVTVTAMMVAVAMSISFGAVEASMWKATETYIDSAMAGDLVLGGDLSADVAAQIRQMPGVEALALVQGCRLVTEAGKSFDCRAINPDDVGRMMPFVLDQGNRHKALQAMRMGGAVVLPSHAAAQLGLKVGDVVRFHRFNEQDQVTGETVEMQVVGLMDATWNGGRIAHVSAADAARYFSPAAATAGYAKVSGGPRPEDVAAQIQKRFPLMQVESFAQFKADLKRMDAESLMALRAILYIALLASALGIVNTLLLSVVAQRRELALLRAVGATQQQTQAMVVGEALFLGLVGAGLGALAGVLFAGSFVQGAAEFIGVTIKTVYPVRDALTSTVLAVVLSVVAAFVPAWRAGKTPVVTGLRAE
jgi:putative ABC transport system permease protein